MALNNLSCCNFLFNSFRGVCGEFASECFLQDRLFEIVEGRKFLLVDCFEALGFCGEGSKLLDDDFLLGKCWD
jgi:hypothetical protein